MATLRRVGTGYLSPTGVAKSKDCCQFSNAEAPIASVHDVSGSRSTFNCAATRRRDVPLGVRSDFKGIPVNDPGARSRAWVTLAARDCSSPMRFGLGTHVRNGSKLRKTRSEHMSSALPPISDIARRGRHFAFVPQADINGLACCSPHLGATGAG